VHKLKVMVRVRNRVRVRVRVRVTFSDMVRVSGGVRFNTATALSFPLNF
jgi:hypothetical protein